MREFEQHIFTVLFHLPAGKLTTYGRLAKSAGYPNHSREVGKILSRLPKNTKLPCVNSKVSLVVMLLKIKRGAQGKIQGVRKYLSD